MPRKLSEFNRGKNKHEHFLRVSRWRIVNLVSAVMFFPVRGPLSFFSNNRFVRITKKIIVIDIISYLLTTKWQQWVGNYSSVWYGSIIFEKNNQYALRFKCSEWIVWEKNLKHSQNQSPYSLKFFTRFYLTLFFF